MRVLLIDDHNLYGPLIQQELHERYGFDAAYAIDPHAAEAKLAIEDFDVVVIDLLYYHLITAFDARRRAKKVSLNDKSFLISGLATLRQLTSARQRSGLVIWSSGEENRSLHLLLAHQEFGVRAYCSKGGPRANGVADIAQAIQAAAAQQAWIDPELEVYMPRRGLLPIGELLFDTAKHRLIWRALALGATTHREIAKLIHYSGKTSRNEVSVMAHRLSELDPGIDLHAPPLDILAGYAARNWQFFLDETVIRMYPH